MPVPQPDEVIELANELKAARIKVTELESRWNAFFSQPQPIPQPVLINPIMPFLKPRIIELLEATPDFSYTVASVSNALDAKENSVGPYLAELVKDGKIERRDRGLYGALRKRDGNAQLSKYEEADPAYQ